MRIGVVMKKKVKIGLFVFIVICVVILNITYKNKNDVIKTKRKKQNNLAIMIKEDGASDYTKSSSKDIPKGNYVLNREKSYCKNNGVIGDYDNTLGKISFSFIGTDSCYLYFDYSGGPIINNVNVKNNILTATLLSDVGLLGYQITSSNIIPQEWNEINGNTYDLSYTLTEAGYYYLYVKDIAGNISKNIGKTGIIMTLKDYIVDKYTKSNLLAQRLSFSDGVWIKNNFLFNTTSSQDGSMIYYYAGNTQNNWLKFGVSQGWYECKNSDGSKEYSSSECSSEQKETEIIKPNSDLYWRIIRTNEDGGIRLLYSGTSPYDLNNTIGEVIYNPYNIYLTAPTSILANGYSTSGEQPNTRAAFYYGGLRNEDNSIYDINYRVNNEYVLLPSKLSSSILVHFIDINNDIFQNSKYLDTNSIFCNDTEEQNYNYMSYNRILNDTPTFLCNDDYIHQDLVGLMTAEEVVYAGGQLNDKEYNNVYYSINGNGEMYTNSWWTMSPGNTDGIYHYVFAVHQGGTTMNGRLLMEGTNLEYGIRPVVSLASCVNFLSGDGSPDAPYEIDPDSCT